MKKMKDQHKKGVKQIVLFIGCAISIANDLGLDNLSNNVNELFGKTSLVQFVFAFLTQLKTCGDLSNIIDCDYIKNKTNNENLPIVYSLDTFLRYGVSAFYTSLYKNENFKCNVQYNCDEQDKSSITKANAKDGREYYYEYSQPNQQLQGNSGSGSSSSGQKGGERPSPITFKLTNDGIPSVTYDEGVKNKVNYIINIIYLLFFQHGGNLSQKYIDKRELIDTSQSTLGKRDNDKNSKPYISLENFFNIIEQKINTNFYIEQITNFIENIVKQEDFKIINSVKNEKEKEKEVDWENFVNKAIENLKVFEGNNDGFYKQNNIEINNKDGKLLYFKVIKEETEEEEDGDKKRQQTLYEFFLQPQGKTSDSESSSSESFDELYLNLSDQKFVCQVL